MHMCIFVCTIICTIFVHLLHTFFFFFIQDIICMSEYTYGIYQEVLNISRSIQREKQEVLFPNILSGIKIKI